MVAMTEPPSDQHPAPQPSPDAPTGPQLYPLLPVDPPRVDSYWLDARVAASPSGVAYTAHAEAEPPVMVIMLSEGATEDAAAVDRFSGTVDKLHIDTVVSRGGRGQDHGRLAGKFTEPEDTPLPPDAAPNAPWVALAYDGSPAAVAEAERVLAEVDLSWLPNLGQEKGPSYALHWIDKVAPGATRQWPLPWPGKPQRAGWATLLISWLIMMLMMALAILIAILLFQATPPQNAPAPAPNTAGSGSGSPSPDSASPSPDSASPSPDSASPSPASGSPQPSGSASASANSPTPNSKL